MEDLSRRSPIDVTRSELARVNRYNLPPELDVRGMLVLTRLDGPDRDGLAIADRILSDPNDKFGRLGTTNLFGSLLLYRPVMDVLRRTNDYRATPNQELFAKIF